MPGTNHDPLSPPAGAGHFATTRWSRVVAAADRTALGSQEALAALCAAYWYPLYAFVRRRGNSADDAQDLTQGFFARLLEKDTLQAVDQERGRFRTFLLAALKHFLSHERERDRAQKRGGGRTIVSCDFQSAEQRYAREPVDDLTPERVFERRWALALLETVLERLRAEYDQSLKSDVFAGLKVYLSGDESAPAYRETANALGMSEGAVKVAVHRLRRRYRELLTDEIAQTVADPADVAGELADLFAALSSPKKEVL